MTFYDLLETTSFVPKNQYKLLIEMQKYFHCEAPVLALPQVRAQSFHYNSILHVLTPPLSKTKRNLPAEEPKSHRCPTVRTQNQPYLYQIIYFPVNKNLHAIRHIFWQDCVKSGKGKTISLILG